MVIYCNCPTCWAQMPDDDISDDRSFPGAPALRRRSDGTPFQTAKSGATPSFLEQVNHTDHHGDSVSDDSVPFLDYFFQLNFFRHRYQGKLRDHYCIMTFS